jgi:signal transduction histidine kinase
MRPGSSRLSDKAKTTQGGRPRLFYPTYSAGEAQRTHDERRNGLPKTITELKQQIAGKIAPQQEFLKGAVAQAIWQHYPAGVVVCDARGRIILANSAAKHMARMEPEGMLLTVASSIWGRLLPQGCGPEAAGWPRLSELLERPTKERECRLVQSSDTEYDVMFSTSPLATATQAMAGAVLMFTNITQVKRRESMLRERAVNEERSRMAAELHDTLCQGLNAIVLMLHAAQASAAQDREAAQRQVDRACEVAVDTLREARASMWTFVQDPMENIDPAASLSQATEQIFNDTPIEVALSLQKQPFTLPPRVRYEIFRIGKEALTNVRKHSQASRVRMELAYRKETLQLSVMDDGRGFVRESSRKAQTGYGLTSMKQRVEGLGGKIKIESGPLHGTRVVAVIPLITEANSTAMAA